MRTSSAALALIRRPDCDPPQWLTLWSTRWKRYSLPGGHKRPDESFRGCLARELAEELDLADSLHWTSGDEPVAVLEFQAHSASAGELTAYHLEIFAVPLAAEPARSAALERIDHNPLARWATEAEIQLGRTADGKPLAEQVHRALAAIAPRCPKSPPGEQP